jgi:hypothetical protein
MSHRLTQIQTGYALVRCALAYGESFFPSHLSHKVSQLARNLLFACDVIDTAYVGWKIKEHVVEEETPQKMTLSSLFNAALLIGIGAPLFVIGTNRLLMPSINLTDLLKSAQIPRETLEVIAGQSIDHMTAIWTKTTVENLTCGLFFVRTILDLILAYLKSDRLPLFHAAIHALTTMKAAQYKTLAIKHNFDFLFQRIESLVVLDGKYDDFGASVKKVKAIFYLNTEGLSKPAIVSKIEEVYNYSSKMFENSTWYRNWSQYITHSTYSYYERVVRNPDQGHQASTEFVDLFRLLYQITLKGSLPPTPLSVRVLHECEIWKPFKGIEVFRLIPRFAIPGQKIPFSSWVEAKLTTPLTRWDTILSEVYDVLYEVAWQIFKKI